jgi:hypothetical protein
MKTCRKCDETKEISQFHRHSGMKDGHLNTCAVCVTKTVAEWRLKNPGCRQKEHEKVRERESFRTREQWLEDRKKNAIGRSASQGKYFYKRKLQLTLLTFTELDEFVFEEACSLRELRKKATGFDWHIDHIVPLNHKKVCGLHKAANFQVVPASWNCQKRNHHMQTYFGTEGY